MASVPTIRVIFDRRKTATAVKKASVEIEVYYNRERTRISTGVSVLKQQWRDGMVVNHPEAQQLNETVRSMYDAIFARIETMQRNGTFDVELLKQTKETEVEKKADFLDWLEERIYKRSVKESTRRQHIVMLNELRSFGLIRSFSDLTTKNIKLWDDALKANRKEIFMEGEDMCIIDKRLKTGTPYTIVLLPKAVEILEKYNYDINLMSNQKCNEYLKLVAHMAHIHTNLTMHVGRHTFATWALTKGVGIETVSKMLAHSDISMTEKYAKVLKSSVISGFHKLRNSQ